MELTFNLTEDRREPLKPQSLKDFELTFGNGSGVNVQSNNWVQGRLQMDNLRQVFVNIQQGKDNEPYDITGYILQFCGRTPFDGKQQSYRVIDNSSVVVDGLHGRFRYTFPAQAFAVAGTYKQAYFRLIRLSDYKCIATLEFDLSVLEDFVFADMVPSDYISPFNDILNQLLDGEKKFKADTQTLYEEAAKRLNDAVTQLTQLGTDVKTTLTTEQAALQQLIEKIKENNLFTQAEADAFEQTIQETVQKQLDDMKSNVQNTLDEFQSQFNGPAFQEAQQASLDTNMMYGESLPPYFQNSFNHVTQGIPSGNDVLNIATIADAHWQEDGANIFDGYTAKSLEHYQWCALSTLYNHADALIALGDNINGDEPTGRLNMTTMHVRAMLQTKYVRTAMFMIRGNHDNGAGHQNTDGKSANEVLDDNSVKNGYGTKFNYYGEVRDGDSFYFYKDFPDKKVRIIGLDSNDIPLEKKDSTSHYAYDTNTAGFRAQQLNWFANKALMLPDNTWQVVVFFHIPFPNAFGQWAEDNTFKNYHHAIAILNAFKNGTSVNINDTSNPDFTITGLQADYSKQGQGTLIAVVNGHLHRDDQDTSILNGTPIIEVTTSASFVSSVVNDSKQRNTNDEDAWDIISINTKERKIHCYRFGRGNDRDFIY